MKEELGFGDEPLASGISAVVPAERVTCAKRKQPICLALGMVACRLSAVYQLAMLSYPLAYHQSHDRHTLSSDGAIRDSPPANPWSGR